VAKEAGFPPGVVWNRAGRVGVLKQVPRDVWDHPDWVGRSRTVERSTGTADRAEGLRRALRMLVELDDAWEACRRDLRREPRPVASMTASEAEAFAGDAETLLDLEFDPEVAKAGGEALPGDPGELVGWAARSLGLAPAAGLLPALGEAVAARLAEPTPTTDRARYEAEARRLLTPGPRRRRRMSLAELFSLFEADPRRAGLSGRTASNYTTAKAVLGDVVGLGAFVDQVDRDDMRRVRDALLALPLAPATKRKYVRAVGSLFAYALREGLVEANVALGLAPPAAAAEGALKRRQFTADELARLFPPGWGLASPVDWMLALGLFQGLRAEECAQLEACDVEEVGGVLAIHVRGWSPAPDGGEDWSLGKSVKNASSVRTVPVHRRIEAALAGLAEARRRAGGRMLLPVRLYGDEGFYGSVRKDVNARLVEAGVKSARTTFHSLRHNFRNACDEAGIPLRHVHALGGWSRGKGSDAGYGDPLLPATLKPSLDRLVFPV